MKKSLDSYGNSFVTCTINKEIKMNVKEKRMLEIVNKLNERVLFRAAMKARKLEFVLINGKEKDE